MNTINRSIRFYRFFAGVDAAGKPLPVDLLPILKKIQKIAPTKRYIKVEDKKLICVIDDLKSPYQLRFGLIRTTDLPLVEELGKLTPLAISARAGLFDAIHIVLFKDNVVGFDFNYFGPRINKFLDYLLALAHAVCPRELSLEPLINPKIVSQLIKMKKIKMFDLRIHKSYLSQIAEVDESLSAALNAAQKLGNPEQIELRIQVNPRSTSKLKTSLLKVIKRIVRRPDYDQVFSKLLVKGFDEAIKQNVDLDLLNEKIASDRKITRISSKSRELDPQSAYAAIRDAYEEKKTMIKKAASVQL